MKDGEGTLINENILKELGPALLKTLRSAGPKMEAEIEARLLEYVSESFYGFSGNGLIKTRLNGHRSILEITVDPAYTDWQNQKQSCALIAEAITDAINKIELAIETDIARIKNKYLASILEKQLNK